METRRVALAVFALALLWRSLYLVDIHDNPFFRVPVIDAELYHGQAVLWSQGGSTGRVPFLMPPLYSALLSLVYRAVGVNFWAAHVLQILVGASTTALTFLVGRRVGGTSVGLVAAAFVGTNKALLFLEGDLLATPLAVCLDVVSLYFLLRFLQDGGKMRHVLAAGIALGVSALAVPSCLIVLPVLAVWLAWRRRAPRATFGFVLATLLPIVPVTVRNVVVGHELVSISANGGINFYMGNNADMHRTAMLRPGPEWRAMQEIPVRDAGLVAPGARDRYFLRLGLRFWREHPASALRQTFEKLLLLVHRHEIMRDFDLYYFRDHFSWLLRVPGVDFAWLFGLALVGMIFVRQGTTEERLLQLTLGAYALGVVLFFVTSRYRAPLLPLLAVFAARGVTWAVPRMRARQWNHVAPAAAVLGIALAVSYVDPLGVDRVDAVEARYRVATTFEKRGDLQGALERYDAVRRDAPDHALAAGRAAVCAQLLGRDQDAITRYEDLLDRHPEYTEAAVNLATLAWKHGEPELATQYFELALQSDPYLAQAHGSYGLFLLDRGEARRALEPLQHALQYDPTWEGLRLDYARALLAAGDTAQAVRELERAARVLPPSDKLEMLRGDALQATGRAAEARLAWQRGLQLNPQNATLRARLGAPR